MGGYFVAGASPDILFRSKDIFDGATPAGNAVAVLNLLDLADRTGEITWRREARKALCAFTPVVEGFPEAVRMLTIAARRYHEKGGIPEEVEAEYSEERAGHERDAAAAGVVKLEHEAERLVRTHLDLGPESAGWRPFRLKLEIATGWHLQANPASEPYLVPTQVKAEGGELRGVVYPAGQPVTAAFAHEPLSVYSGRVEITGEIAGTERVEVEYQACDDARCLPPVRRTVVSG